MWHAFVWPLAISPSAPTKETTMSQNNPWSGSTADRRFFRAIPTLGLTAAGTTASLGDPWLANTAAGAAGAIALDPGGAGSLLSVHFIARDGFGQISTQPVVISASGAQLNTVDVVGGAAGGTVVTTLLNGGALNGAANFGASIVVTPNATTGLVDVLFTWNAGATVGVLIQHRHILLAGSVVVA